MINSTKLILLFLSLSMYYSATAANTKDIFVNVVGDDATGVIIKANPFDKPEYVISLANPNAAAGVHNYPDDVVIGYDSKSYLTLFADLVVLDQGNYFAGFEIKVNCVDAGDAELASLLVATAHTTFVAQEVKYAAFNPGDSPQLKRTDYLKTIVFPYNTLCNVAGTKAKITLTLTQTAATSVISFYIKQLALSATKCHPTCTICDDTFTGAQCSTCAASYFKKVDNTCECLSQSPPAIAVITENPSAVDFPMKCQKAEITNNVACKTWDTSAKLPFDYCKECSGSAQVAQYFDQILTYKAASTANTVVPAVTQNFCDCPVGTSVHFVNSNFQCLTDKQYLCLSEGYALELDTAVVYSYLATVSSKLKITLEAVAAPAIDTYDIKFKYTADMTPAKYMGFKVYYTYKDTVTSAETVATITLNAVNTDYPLRVKVANLGNILECEKKVYTANTDILWTCNFGITAYNPCTDLAYMDGYIPIKIGQGLVVNAGVTSDQASNPITAYFNVVELNIPCLVYNECFINKDYTLTLKHCELSDCVADRTSVYKNGDLVWVKPTAAKVSDASKTFSLALEYASFYYYDLNSKLVSTIDVFKKASVDNVVTPTKWGFPIEITGEIQQAGVLTDGHTLLTLTYKLTATNRRMLEETEKYAIATPVSLTIHISDSESNTALVSALIAILTVLGAAIIGFVIYCLLRKKKIEDKKPQEVKVVETDAANLCTGRDQKINVDEQRI